MKNNEPNLSLDVIEKITLHLFTILTYSSYLHKPMLHPLFYVSRNTTCFSPHLSNCGFEKAIYLTVYYRTVASYITTSIRYFVTKICAKKITAVIWKEKAELIDLLSFI